MLLNWKSLISFYCIFSFSIISFSQVETPDLSPRCNFTQTVGLTDIAIDYSRPSKRDRIVLDHFLNHKIPIATVIGGGYSKNISELAERHSIIFENAIQLSNFIY